MDPEPPAAQDGPTLEPARQKRPGRARRALGFVAAGLGLGAVFTGASALALVLHLDLAPFRRIARDVTNDTLGKVFEGRIVIDEIDHLGLGEVTVRSAVVLDANGAQVIRASGIQGSIDLEDLAKDVWRGTGDLRFVFPRIRIENADVLVERRSDGRLGIEEAFALRPSVTKKPSTSTKPSAPKPRGAAIALEHIEIGHAWVHGYVAPPRALDADVSRLVAALRVSPKGFSLDVEPTGIRERALLPAPLAGSGDYHFHIEIPPSVETNGSVSPSNEKPTFRMWSGFSGRAGGVELLARGGFENGHVSAALELPRAEPEDLALLVPGLPLRDRAAVRLSIDGDAPTFDVDASLELSPEDAHPGKIEAHGRLETKNGAALALDVTTTDFDPSALREDFPQAEIDANARIQFAASPEPRFVADATTQPMVLAGQAIPAADVHVVFDHGELEGRITLHEPGAPVTGGFVATNGGKSVTFQAETFVPALEAAPRLAGPATGSARVRVRGGLADGKLDARVDGSVRDIHAKGDVSLGEARVEGRVRGPLDALELEASLEGQDLHAFGHGVDKVTAHARGPIAAPTIDTKMVGGDVDELAASARIDPKKRGAENVSLRLERDGERIDGKATRVAFGKSGARLEGLAVTGPGIGTATGTLAVDGREITGKLAAQGVDLARVGKILGLDRRTRGLADVDIALTRTARGRKGHVRVQVEDGTVSVGGLPVTGVSTSIAATFDDEHATMDGTVRLVDRAGSGARTAETCDGVIAEVRVSGADGALRGPLLDASTWTKLTGSARVEAKDWDLRCIARRLPVALVLSDIGGTLSTTFDAFRPVGQRFLSVRALDLHTKNLVLAGPIPFGEDKPTWESRSVDVAVKGDLDGATGQTSATVSLVDGALLAELSGRFGLDLHTLLFDPKRRAASLREAPMALEAKIPRRSMRSFQSLPSFLKDKLPPIRGEVALDVSASGTLDAPTIRAKARGFRIAATNEGPGPSAWALPVDVEASAGYDAKKATMNVFVRKDGRTLLDMKGNAEGDISPWAAAPYDPRFDVHAILDKLPLGQIPYFADRDVDGLVSGAFTFQKRGDEPEANARLEVEKLGIGDEARFDRATLSLEISHPKGAEKSRAVAQLELVGENEGRIDATGYAGVAWKNLVPKADADAPADLFLKARAFDLSSLHPLVAGTLSRIGGSLDGDLRVGLRRFGADDGGRVEAKMQITGGVFHIPQMGQELRNASVSIQTQPDKPDILRFDDIHAEGITGAVHGWALAKLEGLSFRGAAGELVIDRGDELPVTFEGVPVGRAYGNLVVLAEKRGRELDLTVRVPELHLTLPASSSRAVQPLDPNPDVTVSHPLGPPKEGRPADALTYAVTFELGDVEIAGTDLSMKLASAESAPPRVVLTDEARLSGDVEISSGSFQIVGKKFEIERGLVRLRQEEAGNPYVNLTARWDAPDGTRVFVDYVGVLKPITEQKLRFRSSPPLSQQAILSMILIGDTPEAHATSAQSTTTTSPNAADVAAGVVGGEIASAQINAILSQIAPLRGLSTRVGTTESGRLRTSVIYELGDTITAQASYEGSPAGDRLGGIPQAAGTDQSTVNRTEVNVDWRFYRNWSLRGSFGFGGSAQQPSSGLDLLWQYRY